MSSKELPTKNIEVNYKIISISSVYTYISTYLYYSFQNYSLISLPFGNIEKYSIGKIIGSGKFSSVFIGTNGKKKFAFKIFKNTKLNYIKREFFILNSLKNKNNIIKLYDIVQDNLTSSITLILEYCYNVSYKTIFPTFNLEDIKTYMYQLLYSLNIIHSKGIMHRDIKPDNIMFNPKTKKLKIGDFGLSEIYFPRKQYGSGVGTLRYMAPELLLGYRFYDYSIDVWSSGVILAELLFKFPFFEGDDIHSIIKSISKICTSSSLLVYAEKYGIYIPESFLRVMPSFNFSKLHNLIEDMRKDFYDLNVIDLLQKMLIVDHKDRITARDALLHPFFNSINKKIFL